jgi:murein DD-endopeptidase MepM/ murein hydrolase activator NlpD
MIRVFPVAAEGTPHFSDDFGAMGRTGKPHQGIDLFADEGTPILAVDDGELRFDEDPLGGHAFYLHAPDGATYYGAHLSAYEGSSPRTVKAGDVIGYVGHTGNAKDTSSHLHFEAHPDGGPAVDAYGELAALTPVHVPIVALHMDPPPLPEKFPPLGEPSPRTLPGDSPARGAGAAVGFVLLAFAGASLLARRSPAARIAR